MLMLSAQATDTTSGWETNLAGQLAIGGTFQSAHVVLELEQDGLVVPYKKFIGPTAGRISFHPSTTRWRLRQENSGASTQISASFLAE